MILCRRRLIKLTTGPVNRIPLADEPGRRFAAWRGDLLDPTASTRPSPEGALLWRRRPCSEPYMHPEWLSVFDDPRQLSMW